MSPLQIIKENYGSKTMILTIIGQMDESNIDEKSNDVYQIIEGLPHGGNLILNFSGLEYMNSKSIGYTTDFFNKLTEKDGKLIIAEAQAQILDILNVVGLTHVIPFVESVQEAKNMIQDDHSSSTPAPSPKPEIKLNEVKPIVSTPVSDPNQALKDKIAQEISASLGKRQDFQKTSIPEENTVNNSSKPEVASSFNLNNTVNTENVIPKPEIPFVNSVPNAPTENLANSPINTPVVEPNSVDNSNLSAEKKSAEMLSNQSSAPYPTSTPTSTPTQTPTSTPTQTPIPMQTPTPASIPTPQVATTPNKTENKKDFPFLLVAIIVGLIVFLAVTFLK